MLELKRNQDIAGEEKGGSLLPSFLCPVASPIKGIYYSPTHHWAGEEVCDSFHIPRTARVGKEKDGKILLSRWQRQSGRDGVPARLPVIHCRRRNGSQKQTRNL